MSAACPDDEQGLADELGTPRAHLDDLGHHDDLMGPEAHHTSGGGTGEAALFRTHSLTGSGGDPTGAPALHSFGADLHHHHPNLQLPLLDLSLAGSGTLAPLHGMHSHYGLLGLPLPGLSLDQPLASYVIGKMESAALTQHKASHLAAHEASGSGYVDGSEWHPLGVFLHQPSQQPLGQPQLLPMPVLMQHPHHMLLQPSPLDRQPAVKAMMIEHTGSGGPAPNTLSPRQQQQQQCEASTGGSGSVEQVAATAPEPAADPAAGRLRRIGSVPQLLPQLHQEQEQELCKQAPKRKAAAAVAAAATAAAACSEEEISSLDNKKEEEEEAADSSSSEDERPRKRRQRAAPKPVAVAAAGAAAVAPRRRARACGDTAPATSEGKVDRKSKAERSSRFRGVTKHRRSGRYEAHIWVKELGRQVYLGGYEQEEHAAEAYDIAAIKAKGRRVRTNFPTDKYSDLLTCIDRMSMEELVMAVRRQSQGFSRGTSSYRGVTHHPTGRWEARIGIPGSKHIYLGLFPQEVEAAKAYDRSLVRLRGSQAATNFGLNEYRGELADYHQMANRLMREDTRFANIQRVPELFEKWVKGGCDSFPDLASPTGGGGVAGAAGTGGDAAAQEGAEPQQQQQQQQQPKQEQR